MKKKKNILIIIIICLLIFLLISLISVYSAKTISNNGNIFIKQLIFYIISIFVLLISFFYKKAIIKYNILWYLGFSFLLLILLFWGVSINGSKCWLIIGPFSFQPSEFMKIFLIIMVAKVLDKNKTKNIKTDFTMLLKIFIILLIPAILTFLEPDTGVVIIYCISIISMILYHGLNKKCYLIIMTIITIFFGSIMCLYFFKKDLLINVLGNNFFYRLERILNWSKGNGYQLENSLITISSSGIKGFGFNNIPLYYPEASTDFIFTTFSSLFGFLGNFLLLFIILFFDKTILEITKGKIKKLDKFLLIGFFTMLLYQQIQNICMTIGLLPITGITLPFISYGGSSLLVSMISIGIVLNVSKC